MWYKSIKELHVEPTSVCNAECPMCARNINGKGLNPYITLKSLSLKWFKDNIQPNKIKQLDKLLIEPLTTSALLMPNTQISN